MRFADTSVNYTDVNGIPLSWTVLLSFAPTNPGSAYYSVQPDVTSTADHFYPTPNIIDFRQYSGLGNTFSPLEYQKSGLLSSSNATQVGSTGTTITDSQTEIQWNKTKIQPGQSVSFVYFIGKDSYKISSAGSLSGNLKPTPSNTFHRVDNTYDPINLTTTLKNASASPVSNVVVKLFYDPNFIVPMDSNNQEISPGGTDTFQLNGITKEYPYILQNVHSLSNGTITMTPFLVRGVPSYVDVNTNVCAQVSFTDVDNIQKSFNTELVILTIPAYKFALTLDTDNDPKTYKPLAAAVSAKVNSALTYTSDIKVEYLMLPANDTATSINTPDQFHTIQNTIVENKHKGDMHLTQGDVYNLYDPNNSDLNGVEDNCTLWVLATGTDTKGNKVFDIKSHRFSNIYTPIKVYYSGLTTSGGALSTIYDTTLVGKEDIVQGDTSTANGIYGVPMDLNGTDVVTDPLYEYDKINIKHKDERPLLDLASISPSDILPLVLDRKTLDGEVYEFIYEKTPEKWWDATFTFVDEDNNPIPSLPNETVTDFIPENARDLNDIPQYLWSNIQYETPRYEGYKPTEYSLDGTNFDIIGFPVIYGDIFPEYDNQTIYIRYRPETSIIATVKEEYHWFTTDEKGNEVDQGAITSVPIQEYADWTGNPFTGHPQVLDGYVYRGYQIDNETPMKVDGYKNSPLDPYYTPGYDPTKDSAYIPYINSLNGDTTIVYQYKKDTNRSGVADEDVKNISIIGVGYDSKGNLSGSLYTHLFEALVGTIFTPIPDGSPDTFGNPYVIPDTPTTNWIYWDDPIYNDKESFEVKADRGIRFTYFKDSGPTGTPDFFEANITVSFEDKINNKKLLQDIKIVENTVFDGYSTVAAPMDSYVAVGVRIEKEGTDGQNIYYNSDIPFAYIPAPLGHDNWHIIFLYKADTNKNGIPDDQEKENNDQEEQQNKRSKDWFERLEEGKEDQNSVAPSTVEPIPTIPPSTDSASGDMNPPDADTKKSSLTYADRFPQQKGDGFTKPLEILLGDYLIPLGTLDFAGPYLFGYGNGTIQPSKTLTRAEAAQVIYNIYGQPTYLMDASTDLTFTDVDNNVWFADAAAFCQKFELIKGYPNGTFQPDQPISRTEFLTILLSLQEINVSDGENHFSDVGNHWAKNGINTAYRSGIISGFEDGTFRPDRNITRQEAVTIINKLLKRPDQWMNDKTFVDLNSKNWAYAQLMNAANGYKLSNE